MVKSIHKADESLGKRKTKTWKFSLQIEKEDDVKKKNNHLSLLHVQASQAALHDNPKYQNQRGSTN